MLPRSATEDLVTIPASRRHDSTTATRPFGVVLALAVTLVGGLLLGAGYGAVIALCGKKYVNICLACSFPFWMTVPAQFGFLWGHLQAPRPRLLISLVNLTACLYAVCVGWVFAVLDGPGLVLAPLELFQYLSDASFYSLWATAYHEDFRPLTPWLLTLRFGSLAWFCVGGLMTLGSETPYPYCQRCQRWMRDEATRRFHYQPSSTDQASRLAANLVDQQYGALYALNRPVDAKAKGLKLSVYCCEGCHSPGVLDATWYRSEPDPHKDATEQMLESGTGQKLVSALVVPREVYQHVFEAEAAKAA
jgi:hypothetical protein